jgi:hypothetical protein
MFSFHDVQIGLEVPGKLGYHRLLLILAQQSVVDEDARELRADCAVQECGDDGRVDSARQSADHAVIADSFAHLPNSLLRKVADAPTARTAAHLVEEVRQHGFAIGRVRYLGMELQTVKRSFPVLHSRVRAGFRSRQRHELVGNAGDLVTMAHPHFRLARHIRE